MSRPEISEIPSFRSTRRAPVATETLETPARRTHPGNDILFEQIIFRTIVSLKDVPNGKLKDASLLLGLSIQLETPRRA